MKIEDDMTKRVRMRKCQLDIEYEYRLEELRKVVFLPLLCHHQMEQLLRFDTGHLKHQCSS